MTPNNIHHPVVDEVIASSIRALAAAAAPFAIAVGMLVLLGWWLDVGMLKSVHPGWVSMKANTAASFVLCGAALAAVRSAPAALAGSVARACAGIVFMVGALVLAEYVFEFDSGLGRLLFHDDANALYTPVAGRMSPGTALGFLCSAGSLLLMDARHRRAARASQWLALGPLAVGYIALVGYLFDPAPFFGENAYTPVAMHTALGFALLGIGLLGARPERGWMAMATGAHAGGVVLRRLLPAAVVLVPGAFWLKHAGFDAGWYDHDTGDLLLLILATAALVVLVCWSALWLNRLERSWREAVAARVDGAERLELVQQVSGVGVWEWDLVSGRLQGSAQTRVQYGLAQNSAVHSYDEWLALVHPDDRASVSQGIGDLFDNPRRFSTEFRIVRADGAVRWILSRGDAIRDADGRPRYLLGINMDVTERRRTEETLRRSQRMDAVGQMAGGIAHDFNNVLAIILGNLGLLKRDLPDDAQIRKRVVNIERSAERAADLTGRLLGFSRRDPSLVEVVDPARVIAEMEPLIARAVTPEISVTRQLAGDAWLTEVDRGQFEDALVNLVLNARDAMAGGGSLVIAAGNARIDEAFCLANPTAREGDFVHVSVSDSGQGICADALEKIFDPFYTTKPRGKGTGLGLAMVLGFVTRSEGFVIVDSAPGEGATFHLYLPRTDRQANNVREASATSGEVSGRHETILVVDDEEELRELTAELLEALEYRVVTAADGQQALERLANEASIALVFSDVVMPGGMNGLELAERALAMRPELRILLTSGHIDAPATSAASWAVDVLVKPYGEEELARRIRTLLDTPDEPAGGS